jgi:hypothetical protein
MIRRAPNGFTHCSICGKLEGTSRVHVDGAIKRCDACWRKHRRITGKHFRVSISYSKAG